jgi:hypothetical protein
MVRAQLIGMIVCIRSVRSVLWGVKNLLLSVKILYMMLRITLNQCSLVSLTKDFTCLFLLPKTTTKRILWIACDTLLRRLCYEDFFCLFLIGIPKTHLLALHPTVRLWLLNNKWCRVKILFKAFSKSSIDRFGLLNKWWWCWELRSRMKM